MELKFLKKVNIAGNTFHIKYDKMHDAASFDFKDSSMIIGIRNYEKSPLRTFGLLCHELMEAIHIITSTRYEGFGHENEYLFVQSHKEFQTTIEIFSSVISKFIK